MRQHRPHAACCDNRNIPLPSSEGGSSRFVQATDSAKVARHLDELLDRVRIRPAVFTRGDQLTTGWLTDEPEQSLLAGAVIALREYLADHPVSRLGVCTGRKCADVYIDASPGAHRRFRSLTCQNRARVSAFRARTRTRREASSSTS